MVQLNNSTFPVKSKCEAHHLRQMGSGLPPPISKCTNATLASRSVYFDKFCRTARYGIEEADSPCGLFVDLDDGAQVPVVKVILTNGESVYANEFQYGQKR
jgi:hypothetical protein